jgi:hypothetical protein
MDRQDGGQALDQELIFPTTPLAITLPETGRVIVRIQRKTKGAIAT